jgi:hypothetical protein
MPEKSLRVLRQPSRTYSHEAFMVRISTSEPNYDVVPQAIFWRPLHYFAVTFREGEDGLDLFRAASFFIGNSTRFDLRTYRGHPEFTATLYLPEGLDDQQEISAVTDVVTREMLIPATAVAWRRGETFEYGSLKRPKADRLREPEASILALKIAAQRPDRTASIEYITAALPSYTQLSARDLARSKSRPQESSWQQVVRNVFAHQQVQDGPFAQGYATRTPTGLAVTEKGLEFLNGMGFSVQADRPAFA